MADRLEGGAGSSRSRNATSKPDTIKPATGKPRRKAETPTLTDDLTGKFLRVGDRIYRTSDDRRPIARLEPDRVKTGNLDALPDIMRIAKANGWTSIRINGGETFRKAAFLAAAAQGLAVENYTPSKLIQAEANRLSARLADREVRRQGKEPIDPALKPTDPDNALKALSERFLLQTHQQNAGDPDLRRAQSLVAQAIAIARTKYPDDPVKAAREVEAKRRDVAHRIANGDRIAAIQIRGQQAERIREITQDQALSRHGRSR